MVLARPSNSEADFRRRFRIGCGGSRGIESSISTCDRREGRLARDGRGRLRREEIGTSSASRESKEFSSTCEDFELDLELND